MRKAKSNKRCSEFQSLESRLLMAATPLGVVFSKGVLTITGTSGNDAITVTHNGNSWTIAKADWSTNQTFVGVNSLIVNAGNGDDSVKLDSTVTIPATLNGNAGNDSLQSAAGNDAFYGGAGDDSIVGGSGNDFVQGGLGDDIMMGGKGVNTLDYSDHTAAQGAKINLTGAGLDGMTGETDTINATFQIVNGGLGNDSITGTNNADTINGNAGNDTINGNGGNDVIYGMAGNDNVSGGDGDDSIYGGVGTDSLDGGNGNDQLITVGGGTNSTVTGGAGDDDFWTDSNVTETITDASAQETSEGAVHRVDAFQKLKTSSVSKDLTGQALLDPTISGSNIKYSNFATNPIFSSSGPSINDINQGSLGDCYFLCQIGSFAKLDQKMVEESLISFGDGTYGVQFVKNGKDVFYRINADLPVYTFATSTLAYAGFGPQNSIWAPLLEKAWTFFRTGAGTYASIASGWMGEVASAFGQNNNFGMVSGDVNALLAQLETSLQAGKSVTVGTYASQPSNSLIVGGHAYSIEAITSDGHGSYTVTVRNPWGVDGNNFNDGANDGYVTVTATQFLATMQDYCVSDA